MSKKLTAIFAILFSLLYIIAFRGSALASPLSQCFNVVTLGADPSGLTASDAAFNSAISQAANSTSPCVYIPGGHFQLTSTLTYSFLSQTSGISILGAGEAVTYLDFKGVSGGGIYFKYPNGPAETHIRDFTITTNGTGGNGSAITLERDDSTSHPATLLNSGSDISYVNFIGAVGCTAGGYWATGVDIKGFNNVDFVGDYYCGSSGTSPAGVAYKLEQSPNLITGIGYNFVNITANFGAIGIEYGLNVQGVQVVNGNFGTSYGVYVDPGLPGDQLAISNSQFGGYFIAAIKDNAGTLNTIINGNTFDGNSGGVAIDITGMAAATITNNIFTNVPNSSATTYGILIRSTNFSFGNYIGENNFNNQGGAGILLQAGAHGIVVGPEAYGSGSYANGVNITDNGTGDTVWAPTPGAWTPIFPNSIIRARHYLILYD